MAAERGPAEVAVCVGDQHGHPTKLRELLCLAEQEVGPELFASHRCLVVFLGDANDRGPDTKALLDMLSRDLPARWPNQRRVFLCGNHDFAMASFLGCQPPAPDGFALGRTCEAGRTDLWQGPDELTAQMHLQGRRWGGNPLGPDKKSRDAYSSTATFTSYGVQPGDRAGLLAALPPEHKQHLRGLEWVLDERLADGSRLVAVHSGLREDETAAEQIAWLRRRDVTCPRPVQLCERSTLFSMPSDLQEDPAAVLVSGHHNVIMYDGVVTYDPFGKAPAGKVGPRGRFVIDSCGGRADLPLSALLLPGRKVISTACGNGSTVFRAEDARRQHPMTKLGSDFFLA